LKVLILLYKITFERGERMNKVRGIFIFAILVLVGAVVTSCSSGGANDYKIALAGPLTGDIAPLGQGMKRGAILAFVEFTNSHTNVKVDLVFFDDRGMESEAVNVAEKIASDNKIIGVVGHLNSGCSIPASSVYNKRNLPMITPASTNPKLTLQGFKNVFRLCPTDAQQGPIAAKFLIKKNISKVFVLDDKTEYGQGLSDEFAKEFEKLGGVVLGRDSIRVGDKDFKAILTKIKSFNPQAVFFGGTYSEGSLLTKQADEIGLKVPFVGGDGLKTDKYMELAGPSSEGDIVTYIGAPITENDEFYQKYKKMFPNDSIEPFDLFSYEATKVLLSAFVNTIDENGNYSREKAIEYISKTEFQGIASKIKFDEKGDNLNAVFTIYVVSNGNFRVVDVIK
jgi:branched-chain amino acid transport system substrate-binding protein